MPIQLTLDPSLAVSPSQFVAAWNADPRTDDLATAEVSTTAGADEGQNDVVLLRTAQTAMPVGAAALYDLIRDVLLQQGVGGPVQIDQETTADGGELLAVTPGGESTSEA
ncbi:MAG: hypothetical protein U0X20_18985 [Caldilineaceae bacterium]